MEVPQVSKNLFEVLFTAPHPFLAGYHVHQEFKFTQRGSTFLKSSMSQSVWAAVWENEGDEGGLEFINNAHLFLMGLEAGKTKVLSDLVSGTSPLPAS